jgi:hypothetical protein
VSGDPYVSVVATSRNDDHGGGMLRRMQIFVNAWIDQCRRHDLASELVLVEWNPPAERESLSEVLRWPADPGPCAVRIVTVPEAFHRRYRHSDSLPLFQMIAKNAGIRRARAPFVLSTNVDILFGDALVSFLAARRLEKGRFYRIDRSDAMGEVPLEADVVEQLEYCRTHLLRVNEREATFASPGAPPPAGSAHDCGKGFRLGAGLGLDRRPTGEAYLSAGAEGTLIVKPPPAGPRVLRMVLEAGPNVGREPLTFHVRDGTGHSLARLPFRSAQRVFVPLPDAGEDEIPLRFSVERIGGHSSGPRALHTRLFEWGWASSEELRIECASRDGTANGPRAVEARDTYEYAQGISLHHGWGGREFTPDGRLYRRAANGATFSSYRATRLPGQLVLDLEAGADPTLDVRVADESGRLVVRRRLGRRERAEIRIPDAGSGGRTTYVLRLAEGPAPGRSVCVHGLRRVGLGQMLRRLLRPLAPPRVDFLHTNACGDFTLMHREHWIRLRGYPEWEAYSMNIDGFMCYAAHADGLQEVVLREPMRIYHIEHGLGSGWSPEGEQKLYERITTRGITWVSKEQVLEHARRMYRQGPLIGNDDGWGLGRETLAETVPGQRPTPQAATPASTTSNARGG